MPEAYIVDAIRTAGGKRGGKLAGVHPVDLGAQVLDQPVALNSRCSLRRRR
jgi:acetyl-CoA C-acetyltransferase